MRKSLSINSLRAEGALLAAVLFGLGGCGPSESGPTAPGTNRPPRFESVRIGPEHPTVQTPITVTVLAVDPDNNPIQISYRWKLNGKELPGISDNTFPVDRFRKGDTVAAEVSVTDGRGPSVMAETPPLLILNGPPRVKQAAFLKPAATRGEKIVMDVVGEDPDGDLVRFRFRWIKNGQPIGEGEEPELDTTPLRSGDRVVAHVIPYDGEAEGQTFISTSLTILNSPPVIVSTPPTALREGLYTYTVHAEDPDQDSLTFRLDRGPTGMTIHSETGLLTWPLTPKDKGKHPVRVVVLDGAGGQDVQDFSLEF